MKKLMTEQEVFELLNSLGDSLKELNIKVDTYFTFGDTHRKMLQSDRDFLRMYQATSVVCDIPTEGMFKFLKRKGKYLIKGEYELYSDGETFFLSNFRKGSLGFKPKPMRVLGKQEYKNLKRLNYIYKMNVFSKKMNQLLEDTYWYWYSVDFRRELNLG